MNIKSSEKIITYELTTEELVEQAELMDELGIECLKKIMFHQQLTPVASMNGQDPRLTIPYFQREVLAACLGVDNSDIASYTPDSGSGKWEIVVKISEQN